MSKDNIINYLKGQTAITPPMVLSPMPTMQREGTFCGPESSYSCCGLFTAEPTDTVEPEIEAQSGQVRFFTGDI